MDTDKSEGSGGHDLHELQAGDWTSFDLQDEFSEMMWLVVRVVIFLVAMAVVL